MALQDLTTNQAGAYTGGGAVTSNNAKVNANTAILKRKSLQAKTPMVANAATIYYLIATAAITIAAIKAIAETKGTGTGPCTLAITGAGNNLLGAATFDLKSLTDDTVEDLTLTGTTSNLSLAAGDVIKITVTSGNAGDTGCENLALAFLYDDQ